MTTSILTRLRSLTGPDRETDRLVLFALDPRFADWWPHWSGQMRDDILPHYTGPGLDAAMTALPEGWEPHRLSFPYGKYRKFTFELFPPPGHPRWSHGSVCEQGETPALAILAAIFSARSMTGERDE